MTSAPDTPDAPTAPDTPHSLPARLYLLACDAEKRQPATVAGLPQLVRAGALTELALRGLLTDEDGVVTPADADAETGDPVLDQLLELVTESLPRGWQDWVGHESDVTLTGVWDALVAEGYVRAERKRVLGLFPTVRHVVADPAPVQMLQARAHAALCGPAPVEEVPDREAALVCLGAVAELSTFATAEERTAHQDRLAALAERSGQAAPALRKAFEEMKTAVMVVATAVVITTVVT